MRETARNRHSAVQRGCDPEARQRRVNPPEAGKPGLPRSRGVEESEERGRGRLAMTRGVASAGGRRFPCSNDVILRCAQDDRGSGFGTEVPKHHATAPQHCCAALSHRRDACATGLPCKLVSREERAVGSASMGMPALQNGNGQAARWVGCARGSRRLAMTRGVASAGRTPIAVRIPHFVRNDRWGVGAEAPTQRPGQETRSCPTHLRALQEGRRH